jgi:predicted PurR-regulated permease PerM
MLILSLSIFTITYISLTIVELVFGFDTGRTFTLALISGVMEFIPYIGPILALLPAFIIGIGISWQVAFAITILYLIIQQIENNLLVPYVMSRSLDL